MRTRHFSSSNSVPSNKGHPSTLLGVNHKPVLLHETMEALAIAPSDIVVDATLGGSGHAKELLKGLGVRGLFIGFDLDPDALEYARQALADSRARMYLVNKNFRNLERELNIRGVNTITKALFDLGWSSMQLDSGLPGQGRGFSFRSDEPLLMTYQKDLGPDTLTAATVVNTWSEKSLADIIFGFGEERYSRRIAKAIVLRRQRKPFQTSRELAETIAIAVPASYRYGRIHPATRTFQALRIAVNDELGALEDGLSAAWKLLLPKGRIAVISFHSIEDRIVKRTFAEWEKRGEGERMNKKPLCPSKEEIATNPRSRSAKLRVIEKAV